MSMHDYVFDRCEDIHRSGTRVAVLETRDLAGGLVEIEAVLVFGRDEDAILLVWELLEEHADGTVHRVQYSYQLAIRTQFLFRYDRDPMNHPEMPEHKHVPPDRRIESDAVKLRDVLDEAFAMLAEIETHGAP